MSTLDTAPRPAQRSEAAPRVEAMAADALTIAWPDGARHRFDALWLRDNAAGAAHRHADNDQRLFDIADLPERVTIADAHVDAAGRIAVGFEPEGLSVAYGPDWLRAHAYDGADARPWPESWDARLAERLDWHDYTAVTRDPAALYAFTSAGLGVHTDNPYRDPVPGLQLLHCLSADATGGASIVVDGFEAARRLKETAPEDYALLTRWRVPFRYRNATTDLQARRPLIEADEGGRPTAIAYNNRSIAPLDLPADVMPAFYRAYRRFSQILGDPDLAVRFEMAPGDLFVVDNRRVMHGREAFTSGTRHLQGCYADRDSLLSQLSVMERQRGGGAA
jgi:gamma-butyrobetaine dioxygenase